MPGAGLGVTRPKGRQPGSGCLWSGSHLPDPNPGSPGFGAARRKNLIVVKAGSHTQVGAIADGKDEDLGIGPINRELARLAFMVASGDARPAALLQAGVDQSCQDLAKRLTQWRELNQQKIAPVNALLQKYNLTPLPVETNIPTGPRCEK